MIRPHKSLFLILASVTAALVCADVMLKFISYYSGHGYMHGLVPLFDMNTEGNIPSWFSSALLLIAAAFLWQCGWDASIKSRPYAGHWKFLAGVFAYLSMDEAASIHEKFSPWLRSHWHTTGFLHYAWVIPASLLVAVLGAFYVKFLLHLPQRTRTFFVLAASMYLGGAIGLECIEGLVASSMGKQVPVYPVLLTLEEAVEMAAVLLFIRTLMGYEETS